MSSKALKWFATVTGLKPTQSVLLRILCGVHTEQRGCFPSQLTLAEEASVSPSTVNVQLDALEAKGLIKRVRKRDPKTRRQRRTFYTLGFELNVRRVGSDRHFDRLAASEGAAGADSENPPDPTPKFDGRRLRNSKRRILKRSKNLIPRAEMGPSQDEATFLMAYSHLVRGPEAETNWPAPTTFQKRQAATGDMEKFRLERQARYGFPGFKCLLERVADGRPVRVDAWVARATGYCVPIDPASPEGQAWKAEHARRGWPWFQELIFPRNIYVPAGGINALNDFMESLREAMR